MIGLNEVGEFDWGSIVMLPIFLLLAVITFAVYSVIYDVFVSTMNSTNLPYANLVILLGGIAGFAFMIGVVWNVVRRTRREPVY